LDERRQPFADCTSRMTRERHVRICERLGVQFPGPTRPEDTYCAVPEIREHSRASFWKMESAVAAQTKGRQLRL
jgi:hypothetical protein